MARVLRSDEIEAKVLSDLAKRRTLTGENLMITRYEVKVGASFETHSHPEEQMGYVIKGKIEFFVGDPEQLYVFEGGTFFHFESNEPHRSHVMEDSMVIDVFSPPRPEYVPEAAG